MTNPITTGLVSTALASIRKSLSSSPAALMAVAVVAGMSATDARAWGAEYENIGRTVGQIVGSRAGSGGFSDASRIGGIVGQTVGGMAGRNADEANAQAKRDVDSVERAREQARRDAAYDAERRRLDPNYTGSSNGVRHGANYGAIGANLDSLNARQDQLVADYMRRNRQSGR